MKKYIALLLAGAMAFSAAACGGTEAGETEASTELNIYMQKDYISSDLIAAFEEENGCKVNFFYPESDTEAVEKLKAGCGEEYDLVMVKNTDMEYLIEEKCLEKIEMDSLPNTSTLNESCWMSKSYGIPYLMKYVYVVYDSAKCPVEITGYNSLLDPALKGQIASVDGVRDLFSIALVALGYSPNTAEESELTKAHDWLVKFDENVAMYGGDVQQALIDGTVSVAITDDRSAAEGMAKKKTIKIAPFEENAVQTVVDMFVIPAKAQHMDLAKKFMNDICDPEVMAANLEEYPYACPNDVALMLASEAYHAAPERDFDYKEKTFLVRMVEDAREFYDNYDQELKAGE